MNQHTPPPPTYLGNYFSLFANKKTKQAKADKIFGLVVFLVWVFGFGFFGGMKWGVVIIFSM